MEENLHYLFKKYLDNTCSEKELEEFLDFVHRAEHDELLRQLIEKVYNGLKDSGIETTHVNEQGRLVLTEPEWLAPVSTAKEIPIQSQSVTLKTKSPKVYTKFLVAAMTVIVAGTIWIMNKQGHEKPTAVSFLTTKATNRSESKFLLLEDSTQVWLNAASSLEFPDHFESKTREVYLSGEAFFDVKHAEKIPFIIHTGTISTTVLGTAFNIKAYAGQKNITISVSRGKVRVMRSNGWEITLTKGQQVKLNEMGEQSAELNIPVEKVAGWQQGNIAYEDETLKDIIADMERIYNVNIHISNQSLDQLSISTSFKKEIGVEQALQVLCRLTDTDLTKNDNDYYIQ